MSCSFDKSKKYMYSHVNFSYNLTVSLFRR